MILQKRTKKLYKLVIYWGPVILWMSVIYFFSSLSTKPVSTVYWKEFFVKKSAHLVEYFTLYVLLYRAFLNDLGNKKKSFIFAMGISIMYAISDEFHQSFTPGREPKVRDIIIDSSGVLLAFFIINNYLPMAPQKVQNLAKKFTIL